MEEMDLLMGSPGELDTTEINGISKTKCWETGTHTRGKNTSSNFVLTELPVTER